MDIRDEIKQEVLIAGQTAMVLYGRDKGQLKPDGSWVTQADLKIERFLRNSIHDRLDARIFGEETEWSGNPNAPYTAIIDPIDGTALFRAKIPIWGISLGIFHRGYP